MVKKIYSSKKISLQEKKESLELLAKIDQSDLLSKTQAFCESAIPDISEKKKAWATIFSDKIDGVGYANSNEICAGFKQLYHRDILGEFADEFFLKIEEVVKTKPKSLAETIYLYLQPNMIAGDAEIQKFENLLEKIQTGPAGETTDRLVKWLKDSICDLKEKKAARNLSQRWEKEQ